jgi:prevent-host-death family protein
MAGAALEMIESLGPQSLSSLGQRLAELELTRARDPQQAALRAIEADDRFVLGPDGRYFSLTQQLAGSALVHRLSWFERRHEVLVLGPEDWLISRIISREGVRVEADGDWIYRTYFEHVFPLPMAEADDFNLFREVDGYEELTADDEINFALASRWSDVVVVGPPGWLADLGDAEYIVLRPGVETVAVTGISTPDFDQRGMACAIDFVRARLRSSASDGASAENLLTAMITEQPQLLDKPLPPISELVARTGALLVDRTVDLWRRPLAGLELLANDHYYDQMADRVTATEAKARLLKLLDRVSAGEEIEITRHGRSIARLVPATGPNALRDSMVGVAWSNASDEELFSTGETWEAS